jgi:hypothetical protein
MIYSRVNDGAQRGYEGGPSDTAIRGGMSKSLHIHLMVTKLKAKRLNGSRVNGHRKSAIEQEH